MVMFVATYFTPSSAQQPARVSPDVYSQLRWRFIGPEGNRISAVAGVPDETWGEVGVAFVVACAPVDGDELIAYCRERLAHYKVPKRVRFVDALPLNAMNKVLKDELRRQEVTA